MPGRKQELLVAAIEYVARHGVAQLSLRPLAAAIGTSARLLIFHFKSKEGLLEQILGELQRQLRTALERATRARPGAPREVPMKRLWRAATQPAALARLRVLYEAQFLALHRRKAHSRFFRKASSEWLDVVAAHLPPAIRDRQTATLCIAVFDGLLIELMVTADLERTTGALDAFIEMLQKRARRRPARPGSA